MASRAVTILVALVASTSSAAAVQRAQSLDLTCAQARDVVKHNGVVIMYTDRNIYQRVVPNARYCRDREVLDPYFTTTKDKRSCRVGYRCRELQDIW